MSAKTAKAKKPQTIHSFVEGMLRTTKKGYAEIAKEARKQFRSNTSPASVRYYASRMRADGQKVKERPQTREAQFA